jgi:hypothetical protein
MAVFQATEEKDKTIRLLQGALKSSRNILNLLADILYKASEVFRRAVDAIIHSERSSTNQSSPRPKLPTSRV